MKNYTVEVVMPRGDITRQRFGSSGDVAAAFAGTIMAQKHAAGYNVELVESEDGLTLILKVSDR